MLSGACPPSSTASSSLGPLAHSRPPPKRPAGSEGNVAGRSKQIAVRRDAMLKETGGGIARFFAVATPSKRQKLPSASPLKEEAQVVVRPHHMESPVADALPENISQPAQCSAASDELLCPTQMWGPLDSPAPTNLQECSPTHPATPGVARRLVESRMEDCRECFLPVIDGHLGAMPNPSLASTSTGMSKDTVQSHSALGGECEDELPGPTQTWGAALQALSPSPPLSPPSQRGNGSMGGQAACVRHPAERLPHSLSPTLSFHEPSPRKNERTCGISAPDDISPTLTW